MYLCKQLLYLSTKCLSQSSNTQLCAQCMEQIRQLVHILIPLLSLRGPLDVLVLIAPHMVILVLDYISEWIPSGCSWEQRGFPTVLLLTIGFPLVFDMGGVGTRSPKSCEFCIIFYILLCSCINLDQWYQSGMLFSVFLCISPTWSGYKELGLDLVEHLQDQPRKPRRPPMAEEKKYERARDPLKISIVKAL